MSQTHIRRATAEGASPTAGAPATVAPFPIDVFPKPLQAFIREGAAAIGCPPDFLAVPMLVLAGMAIGNSRELEIKPTWHEGANLYAATVGDPGSKKSPALKAAAEPFYDRQAQLDRAWKAARKKTRGKPKTKKATEAKHSGAGGEKSQKQPARTR